MFIKKLLLNLALISATMFINTQPWPCEQEQYCGDTCDPLDMTRCCEPGCKCLPGPGSGFTCRKVNITPSVQQATKNRPKPAVRSTAQQYTKPVNK